MDYYCAGLDLGGVFFALDKAQLNLDKDHVDLVKSIIANKKSRPKGRLS